MLRPMNALKRIVVSLLMVSLVACGVATPIPTAPATTAPSLTPIAPSISATTTISPTNIPTASPESDVAPNCKIANEEGRLYLLSDQEFHDLRTTAGKLNRALAAHYPEWANYTQPVPWSTQPVKLGEIIVSASINIELNLQINPAVTLVTLGDSLNWQLPANEDLFSKSREISLTLEQYASDWNDPQKSLRSQYPEVANSGTYALYAFFNYNLDRLQGWCNTYQQLFGEAPSSLSVNALSEPSSTIEPFIEKPFLNPDTSFIRANAFFNHKYPLYSDEGDGYKDFTVRFDSLKAEKSSEPFVDVTTDHCLFPLMIYLLRWNL